MHFDRQLIAPHARLPVHVKRDWSWRRDAQTPRCTHRDAGAGAQRAAKERRQPPRNTEQRQLLDDDDFEQAVIEPRARGDEQAVAVLPAVGDATSIARCSTASPSIVRR